MFVAMVLKKTEWLSICQSCSLRVRLWSVSGPTELLVFLCTVMNRTEWIEMVCCSRVLAKAIKGDGPPILLMLTAPIQLLSAPFQLPPSLLLHVAYVYRSSRYRRLELHVTASIMATSNSLQLSLRRFFSPSSSASVGTTATESKSDEELSESTVDKQPSEHSTGELSDEAEPATVAEEIAAKNAFSSTIFVNQVFTPHPLILMLAKTLCRSVSAP